MQAPCQPNCHIRVVAYSYADVPPIEIALIDEQDSLVSPLGAKGAGEIGITGAAAAIGNAVYHATGKRVRELPITLDKLL